MIIRLPQHQLVVHLHGEHSGLTTQVDAGARVSKRALATPSGRAEPGSNTTSALSCPCPYIYIIGKSCWLPESVDVKMGSRSQFCTRSCNHCGAPPHFLNPRISQEVGEHNIVLWLPIFLLLHARLNRQVRWVPRPDGGRQVDLSGGEEPTTYMRI